MSLKALEDALNVRRIQLLLTESLVLPKSELRLQLLFANPNDAHTCIELSKTFYREAISRFQVKDEMQSSDN